MKSASLGALALLALAGCGGNGRSSTLAGSYVGTTSYYASSSSIATASNLATTGNVTILGNVDTYSLAVTRDTTSGATPDTITGTFPSATGSVTTAALTPSGSTTPLSGTGAVSRRGSVLVFDLSFPPATTGGATVRYVISLRQF